MAPLSGRRLLGRVGERELQIARHRRNFAPVRNLARPVQTRES